MLQDDLLLRSKLAPPRQNRRILSRPALVSQLQAALDYRLTVLHAGAGYGKTTALAGLQNGPYTLCWLSLGPGDTDPQQFLTYLIAAFRTRLRGLSQAPSAILTEISAATGTGLPYTAGQWLPVIDALLNALESRLPGPTLFVLDDYHLVAAAPEIESLMIRLLTYLPSDLHVILSTRRPAFARHVAMATWRARGEVLELGRTELAFTPGEIGSLFCTGYGLPLTDRETALLADRTEGWPIAVQMVWQGLRRRGVSEAAATRREGPLPLAGLLELGPESHAALFEYLARDILDAQPPDLRLFMLATSVLRELAPAACDAVMSCDAVMPGQSPAATLLPRLYEQDLFLVALADGHYRYHHLFHDFLRQVAATDPEAVRLRHRLAAAYFETGGAREAAIYHWLAAGANVEAARMIAREGENALRLGRLDTLAAWIDALPPASLAEHPVLQAYLGDIYRLRSLFDEGLAWYASAERTCRQRGDHNGLARSLRGQALIYLDTVRPAEAERLLAEALRVTDGLTDRDARAHLLEMLAENKLNMGKPAEAEGLRSEAQRLRLEGPSEDALSVRVRLRTGRLDEAQALLESWVEAERLAAGQGLSHPPRAHRESVLILSLILSFRGQPLRAHALAEEGISIGERVGSPFITAVARSRLAHALQIAPGAPALAPPSGAIALPPAIGTPSNGVDGYVEAIRNYEVAIALGDRMAVRRIRAEAMWGLTRAYGFSGDLESARQSAAEGIETGRWAGDPWIVALTELALGGSLLLAGQYSEAIDALGQALADFRACGDQLGRAASRLWLSLAYAEMRQDEHFAANVEDLLALCESSGYDFLFTAPSFLGPPDPRRLVPVLLLARAHGHRPAYVARLLGHLCLPMLKVHPGYQLRVQCLGALRVWRGHQEIQQREWQREKARQLFELLLTHRRRWLQRDEIVDRLWPDLTAESAIRDFKVALNALNRTIEPQHASEAPFAYIERDGTAYRLRPEADLWLDAAAFEESCTTWLAATTDPVEAVKGLQAALRLYEGDYLPDALYEDWATEERERLLALYLRASDRFAGLLLDLQRPDEALEVCSRILSRDPCWERAYRISMLAFAMQGNRPQALRTYQRCVQVLRSELAVDPSPQTAALHKQIALLCVPTDT